MSSWLVYGAYGYTGELIAREACRRGKSPVLAGRSEEKVRALADELDCEARVFGLDDQVVVEGYIDDVDVVLNCAGPFAETYGPLVEAALATETDYLDITGEITVFEAIAGDDDRAAEAGVTLLPGVGFDVVPTDCLAAHLADRLPEADSLAMGFRAEGGFSPGTMKTAIAGLSDGGMVRENGRIKSVPAAHRTREIDFGSGPMTATTFPWGDVSTAYHTTGIETIEFYLALPPSTIKRMRYQESLAPVLGLGPVQSVLQSLVDSRVDGPDEQTRENTRAYVWGEATAGEETVVSRLETPNTYTLTVETALEIVDRVLDGAAPDGFQTPAGAFGPDLIMDIDGVERADE